MPLNDRQIRNLKPTATIRKLSDGGGLALVCKPNGGKYWHLNFRFNGKQKTLSIGTYPTVSLAEARQAAENARRLLAQGQDPAAAKQQAKQERQAALLNTFVAVACRWHTDNLPRWKPNHAGRIMRYFETDVFPLIGETPIAELRVRDIKAVIDSVAARGVVETAEKIRQWINSICNYAAMLEIIDGNPRRPVGRLPEKTRYRTYACPAARRTDWVLPPFAAGRYRATAPHWNHAADAGFCAQQRIARRTMARVRP